MIEFTIQEVTVCGVATFLKEVPRQIQFLMNFQLLWTEKCDFSGE